jgi:hypothetical protein
MKKRKNEAFIPKKDRLTFNLKIIHGNFFNINSFLSFAALKAHGTERKNN